MMRSSKMSLNSNKMKIQFLIAIYASYWELYFGETPIKIGSYYWLYLKINISEFRLILLDHITITNVLWFYICQMLSLLCHSTSICSVNCYDHFVSNLLRSCFFTWWLCMVVFLIVFFLTYHFPVNNVV